MRKWSLFIFVFTFACSPAPAPEEGEGGGETKGVRGDAPPTYRDVEETFTSHDMWRGVEAEPFARDIYGEHYTPAQRHSAWIPRRISCVSHGP